jgi:hypothetical protein
VPLHLLCPCTLTPVPCPVPPCYKHHHILHCIQVNILSCHTDIERTGTIIHGPPCYAAYRPLALLWKQLPAGAAEVAHICPIL